MWGSQPYSQYPPESRFFNDFTSADSVNSGHGVKIDMWFFLPFGCEGKEISAVLIAAM